MNPKEWSQLDKVFDKELDEALTRMAFERPDAIAADYPGQVERLRPLLETADSLKLLQPVTMPQSESLAAGRAAFLAQVDQLPDQAVSSPLPVRLKEWMTTLLSPISETLLVSKERKPMSTILLRLTITIAVLLVAAGGTAVISAESLPDSALYPVKLALEDTRLALTSDSVAEAELNLTLAETRLEEIEEMSLAGRTPDEAVFTRLEKHFDEALRLAAGMPEEVMAGFLTRTQARIRTQENNLAQVQARLNDPNEASLGHAYGILTRLRLRVESGLQEPQLFRHRHGQMPEGTPQENGPCNNGDCEPNGNTNQHGSGPTAEPGGTGNGNGPGDGICDNPGNCEPAGDANQYGPGPGGDGGNGSGPGPGDGVCDNPGSCEPVGDANQNGPGPGGDGGVGSGPGPGDGVCNDPGNCEPMGDANHYGQHNSNNNQNGQQSNQGNGQGMGH